jgi:hypothetical protein
MQLSLQLVTQTKNMEYAGSGSSWATMARPMLHQGLVEYQEPGVPVEGLERVDARVKRQDLGREHRRGRPSCHQVATTARRRATTATTRARCSAR